MTMDSRVSERRLTFFDKEDKEMVDRHSRCQLTLLDMLVQENLNSPRSLEFWDAFNNVRFACVPECASLAQVYDINHEIACKKIMCDSVNITLFKIPRLVNDVEGYVTMLLRKHREEL